MTFSVEQFAHFKKTLVILDPIKGITGITFTGLAKLCEVNHASMVYHVGTLKNPPKKGLPTPLLPFAGRESDGDYIPDDIAHAIIKYYAYKGKKTAQWCDSYLFKTSFRQTAQRALGWQPPALGFLPMIRESVEEGAPKEDLVSAIDTAIDMVYALW